MASSTSFFAQWTHRSPPISCIQGPPSCLPLLAWSWCIPDTTESMLDESSAFLGFARASTIHIARISTHLLGPHAEVSSSACVFSLSGRQFIHQFQLIRTISLDRRIVTLHVCTVRLRLIDSESAWKPSSHLNLANLVLCYGVPIHYFILVFMVPIH